MVCSEVNILTSRSCPAWTQPARNGAERRSLLPAVRRAARELSVPMPSAARHMPARRAVPAARRAACSCAAGALTQRDPVLDGLNWYSYVSGGVMDRIDPTGMIWCRNEGLRWWPKIRCYWGKKPHGVDGEDVDLDAIARAIEAKDIHVPSCTLRLIKSYDLGSRSGQIMDNAKRCAMAYNCWYDEYAYGIECHDPLTRTVVPRVPGGIDGRHGVIFMSMCMKYLGESLDSVITDWVGEIQLW